MWHRLFAVLALAAVGFWGYGTRSPQTTAQPSPSQPPAVAEADTLVASTYLHSGNRSGSGRRPRRR